MDRKIVLFGSCALRIIYSVSLIIYKSQLFKIKITLKITLYGNFHALVLRACIQLPVISDNVEVSFGQ